MVFPSRCTSIALETINFTSVSEDEDVFKVEITLNYNLNGDNLVAPTTYGKYEKEIKDAVSQTSLYLFLRSALMVANFNVPHTYMQQ